MKYCVFIAAMLMLALSACSTTTPVIKEDKKIDLIIGTYSQQGSEGVYASSLNLETGVMGEARLALKSMHPTYLATSKAGVMYGAMRNPGGRVTAFRPVGASDFAEINHRSAQGDWPCYLAFSPDQRFVASANYKGGSVSVFEIGPGGMLKDNPQVLQHTGKGAYPQRQEAPHVHWVQWSPHNASFVYVIDLGLDQVKLYPYDTETGRFGEPRVAFQSAPGEGPRHLVFHPNKKLAYIMHELTNTVSLVNIEDDGSMNLVASRSTLPASFNDKNQGAHISISKNGKYLYTSNRGLNSIAIFDLASNGMMTLRENVSTGGDWPRFFKLFDDYGYMLVANRNSGDINVIKVGKDGGLTRTGNQLKIPHPTYIDEYQH